MHAGARNGRMRLVHQVAESTERMRLRRGRVRAAVRLWRASPPRRGLPYRDPMLRGMRRVISIAAVVVSVAVLSGCTSEGAAPTNSAAPVSSRATKAFKLPPFASVLKTYKTYTTVGDLVAQAGGRNYERIREYVTDKEYEVEAKEFKQLASARQHQKGFIRVVKLKPQSSWSHARLTAYACINISATRLLSDSGRDITPRGRPSQQTLLVSFTSSKGRTFIDESQAWSGASVC